MSPLIKKDSPTSQQDYKEENVPTDIKDSSTPQQDYIKTFSSLEFSSSAVMRGTLNRTDDNDYRDFRSQLLVRLL